jgi:hypothetical protein
VFHFPPGAPILPRNRSYLIAGPAYSLSAVALPDDTTDLGSGGLLLVAPDLASTFTDAVGNANTS